MKKQLMMIAVLAVTLSGGLALQPAFAQRCDNPGNCEPGYCDKRGERMERMAEVLGLSAEQQQQIQSIRDEERALVAPLREQLSASREQMETAVKAQPFDEGAVRSLAAAQAGIRTELTVARARMQNRIHSVLTPEQRTLAEKLRPMVRGGKGGRHGAPQGGQL
jgi:protein CpxP